MHPHPLFGIDTFFLLLALACILGTVLFIHLLRGEQASIGRLLLFQASVAVGALAGAKLLSLALRDWQLYRPVAHEITSGWRYPGAVLSLILLLPLFKRWFIPRLPLLRCGDALVVATAFSMALIRVNCFLKGCCTGAVCHGALCVQYARESSVWFQQLGLGLIHPGADHSAPVMPLHLYFFAASLAVGCFLVVYRRYQRFDGELIVWFLLLHEGSKALLETFRFPPVQGLQIVSAVVAVVALLLLAASRFRRRPASVVAG